MEYIFIIVWQKSYKAKSQKIQISEQFVTHALNNDLIFLNLLSNMLEHVKNMTDLSSLEGVWD